MCDTLGKPDLKKKIMQNIFKEFSTRFTNKVEEISQYVDEVSDKNNKNKFNNGTIQFIEKIDKIRLQFQNIEHHDLIDGDEKQLSNALV